MEKGAISVEGKRITCSSSQCGGRGCMVQMEILIINTEAYAPFFLLQIALASLYDFDFI